MTYIFDIAGLLIFRKRALRTLSARAPVAGSAVFFGAAFLLFVLLRNTVYAGLIDAADPVGPAHNLLRLNLVQILLFLSLVYVPAIIVVANAIAGDGLGLSFSREEYRTHIAVLFTLWGALLLVSAPLQLLFPQFLVIGIVSISIGLLVLILLLVAYTVWVVKELNYLSVVAAFAVFALSWFTLPVFYFLTAFLVALPFFVLIPLFYVVLQRVRAFERERASRANLQQHLNTLTLNPQDADAHYQLGLIHLNRGHIEIAQGYFERALKISDGESDYHYHLGRAFEAAEDWPKALEQYEETYRLNPHYGHGDIFREVGKGYLQIGSPEKAIEFLRFFLQDRHSDPEGRYWLAVALQKTGAREDMQGQLRTLLEQARSSPRFFRKENRKWLYRARALLRG